MNDITRVLCVCKGNSDRSPMMAAVLQMYLDYRVSTSARMLSSSQVSCESAGILEIADGSGGASPFMVTAAERIGIDLSEHKKRWISRLATFLGGFDLFVCVNDEVAAHVISLGVDIKKVCNAQIPNPWPSQFQQDYDDTAGKIMDRMFHVVTRYFSSE